MSSLEHPLAGPDRFRQQPPAKNVFNDKSKSLGTRRRAFLNAIVKGAEITGGVALASLAGREVVVGMEGLQTEHATFVPLYELHDVGIAAANIPHDLNIVYRELLLKKEDYDLDPQVLLNVTTIFNTPLFEPEVLSLFAKSHTTIMLGDISETDQLSQRISITDVEYVVGAISGFGSMLLGLDDWNSAIVAKRRIKELNERERLTHERAEGKASPRVVQEPLVKAETFRRRPNGRRRFLKAVLAAIAAWGVSHNVSNVANMSAMDHINDRNNAVQRIITRIAGIEENAHPEFLTVFYRSLFMAIRLLYVAEQHHKETGTKPKIGMMIGAGHAGIEDLLIAGTDVCLALLNMFPNGLIRNTVKSMDGSVATASTSLLFTLPEGYDPNSENLFQNNAVVRTKVVDPDLLNLLNKKVAA